MIKKYKILDEEDNNTPLNEPMAVYASYMSEGDVVQRARLGFRFEDLTMLTKNIQKKLADIAWVLGVSIRTLQRYSSSQKLSVVQSERLLEITRLYGHGYEVFDEQGQFHQWMDLPNSVLGGVSPFSLLDTHAGVKMVDDLLGRIAHGVIS